MYPNDKLPVGDEFKNIERYDEKQQKNRTRSYKMGLIKEESPENLLGGLLCWGMASWINVSLPMKPFINYVNYLLLKAGTAIHIKSPVNSWYFQPLFFACCQHSDYKAFLHWWVIQSYLAQQGLLCMELIHKKLRKKIISCSKFRPSYLAFAIMFVSWTWGKILNVLEVTAKFQFHF